nr:hypothetical protein CFP56_62095 [Quercus suber]
MPPVLVNRRMSRLRILACFVAAQAVVDDVRYQCWNIQTRFVQQANGFGSGAREARDSPARIRYNKVHGSSTSSHVTHLQTYKDDGSLTDVLLPPALTGPRVVADASIGLYSIP